MKKIFTSCCLIILFLTTKAQQNTILILADDIGTDYFGFSEDAKDTVNVPNIRTLLSNGVRFNSAWACPVCSPTRTALLTGKYPFRNGVGTIITSTTSAQIDSSEMSIAKLLKFYAPVKYNTGCVGKWHMNIQAKAKFSYPNYLGFDLYSGSFAGQLTSYYNYPRIKNGVLDTVNIYATTQTVNDAINWLDTMNSANPFFLWLGFNAPHVPYHKPPDSLITITGLTGTKSDITLHPKKYFKAAVEAMDTEIGRLFQYLNANNLMDSTNIIFIGDNGTGFLAAQIPDKNKAKGSLYDYGVHVPFIISGPAVVNPGRTSSALVSSTDLFATIADLCGFNDWLNYVPAPKLPLDSKSLLPIIQNSDTSIRAWNFSEQFTPTPNSKDGKTIRNSEYQLIRFDSGIEELYSLTRDTLEDINLLVNSPTLYDMDNYYALCDTLSTLIGSQNYCAQPVCNPAVTISTTDTIICQGAVATFTPTPTNGGTAPQYKWKVNGSIALKASTFTTNTLNNGDVITCEMSSNSTCVSTPVANSNSIAMTVNSNVVPTININTPLTTICSGTVVTFNATPTNGGPSPVYQWKVNGNNIGTNNSTFTDSVFNNGDVISCEMTSNGSCSSTVISNVVTLNVLSIPPAQPGIISGLKIGLCDSTTNFLYTINKLNSATSYTWNIPANSTLISGQGTDSLVIKFSSTFFSGVLSVTANNACGSSLAKSVVLYAKPTLPVAVFGPSTVCAFDQNVVYAISSVPNANYYKWVVPPGCIINNGQGTNLIWVNFGSSAGDIKVRAQNTCGNSSYIAYNVSINCKDGGSIEINDELAFNVINPFENSINILANNDLNNASVTLYDFTGREISKWNSVSFISDEMKTISVDENFPQGVYFLSIKSFGQNFTAKLFHE